MAKKVKHGKKSGKSGLRKRDGLRKIINMKLEKETKGTIRYQEVDDAGEPVESDEDGKVIGQMYIRKSAFKGVTPPDELVVIIQDRASVTTEMDLDDDENDDD